MALTEIKTSGIADDAITTAKLADAINTARDANSNKVSSVITALNNATANELVTIGATTTELDGEANLTYDGSTLTVGNGGGTASTIIANSTSGNQKVEIRETTDGNSSTGIKIQKKHGTLHPANHWYGDIRFEGWDGSGFHRAGLIECVAEGTPANDNMPGGLRFHTNSGASNVTERLRIKPDGKIGIGTTTPALHLEVVSGTDNDVAKFRSTDAAANITIADNTGTSQIGTAGNIMTFLPGSAEKMRLTNDGNLAINTNAPTTVPNFTSITLKGTGSSKTGFISFLDTEDNEDGRISVEDGEVTIWADPSDNTGSSEIIFKVDGTERARFNNNAEFIFGRTNSTLNSSNFGTVMRDIGRLKTSHDVNASNIVFSAHGNVANDGFRVMGDGDCENANNNYGSTSDENLKQDIVDAASQWNDIKAVKVKKFRFKSNPSGPLHIGVIAQDLEKVSPGLVKETVPDDDKPDEKVKSVKYSILYMKAIKALQEAMAKIETLETKVAALESA